MSLILEVKNLSVSFDLSQETIHAVKSVNFQLFEGETIGIVGESGCGKSVLMHSLLKLIPLPSGKIESGSVFFEGKNLLSLKEKELSSYRGKKIGMVFQDPFTSLNPTMIIGKQIMEPLLIHNQCSYKEAKSRTMQLLHLLNIPNPSSRFSQYPHELSGGMKQRIMIAISLACNPKILIADEPTTALDVTIQAQILDLLREIKKEKQTGILLITHDLGVISSVCDRVLVMYAGKIIETGSVEKVLASPLHPYTQMLLDSLFRLDKEPKKQFRENTASLLIQNVKGCSFTPRCPYAMNICAKLSPPPVSKKEQTASCWLQQRKNHDPSIESKEPEEILPRS